MRRLAPRAYGPGVIGHALLRASGPEALDGWDRPIAAGFAVGSLCFFVGPFPGVLQLIGSGPDAVLFFVGSLFFTFAAALELRQATLRRGVRFGGDPIWWSAAIQFVGTLLFNLDTFDAMQTGLSTQQDDRLIWTPDLVGSAAFLISGALAYRVASSTGERDRAWRMAAVNLLGCVLFGISAIASYVVPDSGSILDLAAANWGTGLGAACFFAGAVLLWPIPHTHGPKEVRT
jgi:YrhK-like protein